MLVSLNGRALVCARPQLGSFATARTPEYMVKGLTNGLTLSGCVTFGVLVVALGSPLVALYAMTTIALVVASLFAFVSSYFGWQLGHAEAIAGTIVLGFAIDYCVHLAHAYLHAPEPTCSGKARAAVAKMGNTVIAGSLTTLGSAVAMAFTQANVYHKMGVLVATHNAPTIRTRPISSRSLMPHHPICARRALARPPQICVTVVFACMYALLFFAPLCAVLGPTSPPFRFGVLIDRALTRAFCAPPTHPASASAAIPTANEQSPRSPRPSRSCSTDRLILSPRPPVARVNPECRI
jgi:hypothetical protein